MPIGADKQKSVLSSQRARKGKVWHDRKPLDNNCLFQSNTTKNKKQKKPQKQKQKNCGSTPTHEAKACDESKFASSLGNKTSSLPGNN